ncbi:MAG: hypothetical protein GFH25_541222n74 [Chloroflexi bacterium AL-N10]|nr:hypothetical protein [Chloroflexi bacterium AL-N1]NOK70225.1 hypothetical protein [Chloroflexi bacterium AL-N10]NOK77762.1 hypothetical protein [Chloroflexi bacterium AL-N5]NOK92378.1 hypothetical protein [Chloroflexi bacterium AL-N15]
MVCNRFFVVFFILLSFVAGNFVASEQPVVIAAVNNYVVDNAGDSNLASDPDACTSGNSCSLRQAIERSNSDTGSSEITFQILANPANGYDSTTGTWTIEPNSPLPTLSAGDTTILGRNDNVGGTSRIVLDGSSVPTSNAVGFRINSANNVIEQMTVINFGGTSTTSGIGIRIFTSSAVNNTIAGNYIGNRPANTTPFPNRRVGIQIDNGATDNIIGLGIDPGDRNVISGNGTGGTGNGVLVLNAPGNKIQGNYIGIAISASSTIALPNAGFGIEISDSSGNIVGRSSDGGFTSNPRNIVSGNGSDGILITGEASTENEIRDNYIGVNELGDTSLSNGGSGIQIAAEAKNNLITGSIISGNSTYGILITDNQTAGNQILSNRIGVNIDGDAPIANGSSGVRVQNSAYGNVIGSVGQPNIISGNDGYGVSFGAKALATEPNSIIGNIIGLNVGGNGPVPNTSGGVILNADSRVNVVGGAGDGEGNIIGGNTGPGVVISGTNALSNTVVGNFIGTDDEGGSLGNDGSGIVVGGGATFTRIGGSAEEGNVIALNTGDGIQVTGSDTFSTTIRSNAIGYIEEVDASLGNGRNGVSVLDGAQATAILSNQISGNAGKGINLDPATTDDAGNGSNSNHDINPPFDLRLNQSGQLTGRILVDGAPASCVTCTLQIFTPDLDILDGQGLNQINTVPQIDSTGNFTATLPGVPKQIAVTATDLAGNTSEFAVFDATVELEIEAPQTANAFPTETVIYPHTVRNVGTVDLEDLTLIGNSTLGWTTAFTPSGQFALEAGGEADVALFLTLPIGTDPSVIAGSVDETGVTVQSVALPDSAATVTNTTTVSSAFVLNVEPLGLTGSNIPGETIPYVHTITNLGNLTGTVELEVETEFANWTTELTPTSIFLPPGQATPATVRVTIPSDAISNTRVDTTLTINTVDPLDVLTPTLILTDTTIVALAPEAQISPLNVEVDGVSGEVARLQHTVTNLSNGPATFRLTAVSSLGSEISFVSLNPSIPIASDGTFTLDTEGNNVLNFAVEVTVSPTARTGDIDQIAISLFNQDGILIAGAQDQINVVQGLMTDIYLPIIRR